MPATRIFASGLTETHIPSHGTHVHSRIEPDNNPAAKGNRKDNKMAQKTIGGGVGKTPILRKLVAGAVALIATFSLGIIPVTALADETDDSLAGLTDEQLAQLDDQLGIMPLNECAESGTGGVYTLTATDMWHNYGAGASNAFNPARSTLTWGQNGTTDSHFKVGVFCNYTRLAITSPGGSKSGQASVMWAFYPRENYWLEVAVGANSDDLNFGPRAAFQVSKDELCNLQITYKETRNPQSIQSISCGNHTASTDRLPAVHQNNGKGLYSMSLIWHDTDPTPGDGIGDALPDEPDPDPDPVYYTLSYNKNASDASGSMSSTRVAAGDSTSVKQNGFTRSGYTFIGWATSPNGSVVYQPGNNITLNSNITLYAKWQKAPDPEPEPVEHTLSYDKNAADATGSMSSQTGEEGSDVIVKENGFTRPGYTFQGWATSPYGGVSYNPGDPYRLTGDATLYAVWKKDPVNYTLTYDKNAADATGTTASQTGEENTSVNLRDNGFTRPNYTFQGWADTPDGPVAHNPGDSYTLTGNKTMYAVWKRNAIHLNYDANGGNGKHDPTEGEVNTNITIPGDLNDSFDRPGYEITSWNTKPDGSGTTYQPGGNVPMGTTDQTLYAQWDPIDVQIKYDPNGGEGSHDPTKGEANSDITIPSDINAPFHRDHYELTGWNTKPDGSGDSYAPNDKVHMGITDQTLYAQWKRIPVKVNYDPNGGNGSHDPTTGDAGSDITIPSDLNDPFTKPGSILIGWNTKPDGSGDSYEPGDKIPMGDEDETLYAQWQELANVLPTTGGEGMNMPIIPIAIGGCVVLMLGAVAVILRRRGKAFTR